MMRNSLSIISGVNRIKWRTRHRDSNHFFVCFFKVANSRIFNKMRVEYKKREISLPMTHTHTPCSIIRKIVCVLRRLLRHVWDARQVKSFCCWFQKEDIEKKDLVPSTQQQTPLSYFCFWRHFFSFLLYSNVCVYRAFRKKKKLNSGIIV